jgi:hypothetical protein
LRALEVGAKRWKLFIAHAGSDLAPARRLFELLAPRAQVFLDDAQLRRGDNCDRELAGAQRDSPVTVVLVSRRTEAASAAEPP